MTLQEIFEFKNNLGLAENDTIYILSEGIRIYFNNNVVELLVRTNGTMTINSPKTNLDLEHLEAHARAFEFIKKLNLPAPETVQKTET